MWGLMLRNFAIVFGVFAIILVYAKIMGYYEKTIIEKNTKKQPVARAILAVLSFVIAYGIVFLITLFSKPPLLMQWLMIAAMGIIMFKKVTGYVERTAQPTKRK